jgi:uncharacterized protein YgiM (DUF1202 family)
MDLFKIGKWLVLFSVLVGVALLGMFGAAAQTSPPIFATNTPHSTTVNPTRPANASTPAPNTTTSETGITRVFYALGRANVRECTRLDCAVLGQLTRGEAVSVIGESAGASASSGNTLWYQVEYQGREAYIYGDLLSANPVTSSSQSIAPVGQVGQQSSSSSSRRSLLTCNQQDNLSCSDFANIAQAQFHLNMCGDEDNLDTDDDGFACEVSQS